MTRVFICTKQFSYLQELYTKELRRHDDIKRIMFGVGESCEILKINNWQLQLYGRFSWWEETRHLSHSMTRKTFMLLGRYSALYNLLKDLGEVFRDSHSCCWVGEAKEASGADGGVGVVEEVPGWCTQHSCSRYQLTVGHADGLPDWPVVSCWPGRANMENRPLSNFWHICAMLGFSKKNKIRSELIMIK